MLSADGVRHSKLSVRIILNEGVEAAGAHFGLQYHLAVGKVFGVYFYDPDMRAVDWRVEQVQIAAVKDKIPSRLAIFDLHSGLPRARFDVVCR